MYREETKDDRRKPLNFLHFFSVVNIAFVNLLEPRICTYRRTRIEYVLLIRINALTFPQKHFAEFITFNII